MELPGSLNQIYRNYFRKKIVKQLLHRLGDATGARLHIAKITMEDVYDGCNDETSDAQNQGSGTEGGDSDRKRSDRQLEQVLPRRPSRPRSDVGHGKASLG